MDVYNSSNVKIGEVEIKDNKIFVQHFTKPLLIIEDDEEILQKIEKKDESGFITLFDDYNLLIGEIAALYGMTYSTTRKHMIAMGIHTKSNAGRRNSSYGQKFSEERKKKIGEASRGRKVPQYERTPEIRNKISEGLKRYYSEHEVSEETRQKLSEAWARGCYKNANMGRGYNGNFYSVKNNKDFFFRSLLELKYLIDLEKDESVKYYTMEPFQINLSNGHHYTPDVFINGEQLIELKPKKHLLYEDKERWDLEVSSAEKFCKEHGYTFQVIYDEDIGFETRKFKKWLLENEGMFITYNIRLTKDISDWS